MHCLGIDLGSTTIKYVLLDEEKRDIAHDYVRHQSAVSATLEKTLAALAARFPERAGEAVKVLFSGSGALRLAEALGAAFVQEVVADAVFLKAREPNLDVAVELGGEDAKLLYLSNGVELRMNEACAGGTGAFIDQMASLLHTDAPGLNALAAEAKVSHPIASRCGVFAKTDVVSLLNAGIPKSEIARSVFDAVAEQTIGGLACGRAVKGRIAFLGGPLSFLSELRAAFERKLDRPGNEFLAFDDAHFAVAHGTALEGFSGGAEDAKARTWPSIAAFLETLRRTKVPTEGDANLPPLFANEDERREFEARHAQETVSRIRLEDAQGDLFLGVDLGSTTVKGVVTDAEGRLAYSWYEGNEGNPLEKLYARVTALLEKIPQGAHLRAACTTGYGAELAKAALGAPFAEVETLAHQRAAVAFDPQTSYVIDIGGQDMKCLEVRSGLISSVKLNEACSSGCGSFLQTFAQQLSLPLADFVQAALRSKSPCDLGTRCTVFMNSKVRQAQRDGAPIEDIAAGLCRSIVRNALYKVLRIHDAAELGEHVVVQGGTFLNDAVLRAFEQQIGRQVIRPDIAGLMGAYGAALIAAERTTADTPEMTLTPEALDATRVVQREFRCKGCGNHCMLKMNRFPTGQKFFSGNRCDFAMKSGGRAKKSDAGFIDWKLERLFGGEVLDERDAPMGVIGIPRVLNMYEHYPYWRALFTELGFSVRLTRASDHGIASLGNDTIPSQTLCFPAKLAHGHMAELAAAGVKDAWMPCIPREGTPYKEADGRFACPVVGGYPEALRLNADKAFPNLRILTPFLDLSSEKSVERALLACFPQLSASAVRRAIKAGEKALADYRAEIERKGEEIWRAHEASGAPLIVLAGHPYHLDPLVNHGIPSLIESMGAAVVTEDAVAHLAPEPQDLEVVNQWTFHSRLYRAATLVLSSRTAELVQLVSFGCGLDAITSEQIKRLLEPAGKLYTMLKIDEGDTLGAARIRLRSLLAAVEDRRRTRTAIPISLVEHTDELKPQAPDMTPGMTLYAPQMAPIHFPVIGGAMRSLGWNVKLLPEVRPEAIELGLRHVNNDACYPAIVVIGQLLDALLHDPTIDKSKSAFLLTQTCGPCRATNYPNLLKWALKDLHCEDIPVVCIAGGRIQGAEQLKIGIKGLHRLMMALLYGDMMQRLLLHVRAYELTPGSAQALIPKWTERGIAASSRGDDSAFARDMKAMVKDFLAIPMSTAKKPRVGIVGEILLKYHPTANLHIVDEILAEGAEPQLGDMANFFLYCLNDHLYQAKAFGGSKMKAAGAWLTLQAFERLRKPMAEALKGTGLPGITTLKESLKLVDGLVSAGQEAGEGWLLTAEMLDYIRTGTDNVVCLQPFGCLPNHITGKGVMRRLRSDYPDANLCAIDFEAGTSRSNVANRLKLFLAQARETFAKKNGLEPSASQAEDSRHDGKGPGGHGPADEARRIIRVVKSAAAGAANGEAAPEEPQAACTEAPFSKPATAS